jgi:hypothetical protein
MAALGTLGHSPAAAQDEPGCWITRDGPQVLGNTAAYYDQAMTETWLRTLGNADGSVMAAIAGTYYTEIPAPALGMISYQYRSYDANGLFRYEDRTCSQTGCSQNAGHGRWAAHATGRGTVFMMITWSDLVRTNACAGGEVYPDGANLVDSGGGQTWIRVR